MNKDAGRRPYAKVYPYTWRQGNEATPGIVFRHGPGSFLHVTPAEAYELANTLTDLSERIEAGELLSRHARPAKHDKPQQVTTPLYTSHSAPLTAADCTPESALPATSADHE